MIKDKKKDDAKIITLNWRSKPILFNYSFQQLVVGFFVLIIIPVVVSYLTFNYEYSNTVANEQKKLASGYISDLEYVNQTLNDVLGQLDDPNNPDYHKNAQRIVRSLYPSWGLYYSNRQDIQKFNVTVSNHMYNFYHELLVAEDGRIIFNNFETLYPSETDIAKQNAVQTKINLYNSIYNLMHDCRDKKIPILINELKEIRDS